MNNEMDGDMVHPAEGLIAQWSEPSSPRTYRLDRAVLGAAVASVGLGCFADPFAGPRLWTETNRLKGAPHFTSERPLTKRQRRRLRGKASPPIHSDHTQGEG